jgi:TatD DNase family protein
MTELIDTHTHIYLPEFDSDRDEVIARAVSSGVKILLMPNIDKDSVAPMLAVEKKYPGVCMIMFGLHPTSVKSDFEIHLEDIFRISSNYDFKAVGEIGIDLYWDKTFIREQIIAFKKQVKFALEKELPVVIHARESFREIFEALEDFKGTGLKGVFHAFTGTMSDAEKAVSMGFMLGIGGIVTFKNSGLDKIVSGIGIENIILETDSPYLAPVPYRGKRNESSYLCLINRKVAEISGLTPEETASVTYRNSVRLFGL